MEGEIKLFKVLFSHVSVKSDKQGIQDYVICNSEEQLYSFIDKEYNYDCWKDKEDELFNVYNNDYKVIGNETFKEKILRLKGEMNDNEYDYSDAYYGITLYGWEFIKDLNIKEFEVLECSGIIKVL